MIDMLRTIVVACTACLSNASVETLSLLENNPAARKGQAKKSPRTGMLLIGRPV